MTSFHTDLLLRPVPHLSIDDIVDGVCEESFVAVHATRPSDEYWTPTGEEWEEFLGHFERRRVALGDCGRAYGTSCVHEHSCL